MQRSRQDPGDSRPSSGRKQEAGISQGTGDGSVLFVSAGRGGKQLLMEYIYVVPALCHGTTRAPHPDTDGHSWRLLRVQFVAGTVLSVLLLLFKTQ